MRQNEIWFFGVLAILTLVCGAVGFVASTTAIAAVVGVVLVLVLGLLFAQISLEGVRTSNPVRNINADLTYSEKAPDLRLLMALSLTIRIVGAVVFNITGLAVKVAPDTLGYTMYGQLAAQAMEIPGYDPSVISGYQATSFYQQLNGVVIYLFDVDPNIPLSIINAFAATLACWTFSRLAFRIYGAQAAKYAFILCAFCPSIVLWTSINMRDAWSFLVTGIVLYNAHVLRERFSVRHATMLILGLLSFPFIRTYMLALLGLAVVASYTVVRIRQIPVAIVGLSLVTVLLTSLADRYGVSVNLDIQSRLELLQTMRSGLAYGGSAFESVDISTPSAAIMYLPKGLSYFLLAPFPWRLSSWRQVMALPETLIWYFILFRAIQGMAYGVKEHLSRIALPLFAVAIICVAYALVEGNEGTAYRHRAHALLIFFVFAAGEFARRSRNNSSASEAGSHAQLAGNSVPG